MKHEKKTEIKAIIGLGNPGEKFTHTRHNIGFRVVDALADKYGGAWKEHKNMSLAEILVGGKKVLLVKPQTYMNSVGDVIPYLRKKGISASDILVVHDELELPFNSVKHKFGGSAKGHNGLRSLISHIGQDFLRVRCGIGRPEHKEQVSNWVLGKFSEGVTNVELLINKAINTIEPFIIDSIDDLVEIADDILPMADDVDVS